MIQGHLGMRATTLEVIFHRLLSTVEDFHFYHYPGTLSPQDTKA
jgi:hypothetical protein